MTLVCPDCFGYHGLKLRIEGIRPDFPDEACDFHPRKKGIPISAVAEIVDPVIRNGYIFGDHDPLHDVSNDRDLHGILRDLTRADDNRVFTALAESLVEGESDWLREDDVAFYSSEHSYTEYETGYQEHSKTWNSFRHEILHEQRFFNQSALLKLREIFDGLHRLRDDANEPTVYELTPGEPNAVFIRARKANTASSRSAIEEDQASKLGPPPENLRRAGRMNSSGILAFYGAFDVDTCVAELRPAVGETVTCATFALTRPILVLDTTRFTGRPKTSNIFAPTYAKKMMLWKFMTTFMNEIAKSCLPDDEHLDYVPTQVVSEYLTHLHKFKRNSKEQSIDAIIYRSSQNGTGKNIAIFGDAGLVKGAKMLSSKLRLFSKPALEVVDGSLAFKKISGILHNTTEPTGSEEETQFLFVHRY